MVDAVRLGTVVAHDRKAADRWRRSIERRSARRTPSLTGAALESAVMGVAAMFPENVLRVAA